MRSVRWSLVFAALAVWCGGAAAQTPVGFAGLEVAAGGRIADEGAPEAPARDFQAALATGGWSVGERWYDCASGEVVLDDAPSEDAAREAARRAAAFAAIRKVCVERGGAVHVSDGTLDLLGRFFQLDAGAWFARRILAEVTEFTRAGHLALREGACDAGGRHPLHEVLTGDLTFEGYFREGPPLFEIQEHEGYGGFAQPGFVSLGAAGFPATFSGSGQRIDPLAIVAHELGHTRYGDRTSGGTLEGERRTVAGFENPVRILDGFPPRRTYYSHELDRTIDVETGVVSEGPPAR